MITALVIDEGIWRRLVESQETRCRNAPSLVQVAFGCGFSNSRYRGSGDVVGLPTLLNPLRRNLRHAIANGATACIPPRKIVWLWEKDIRGIRLYW